MKNRRFGEKADDQTQDNIFIVYCMMQNLWRSSINWISFVFSYWVSSFIFSWVFSWASQNVSQLTFYIFVYKLFALDFHLAKCVVTISWMKFLYDIRADHTIESHALSRYNEVIRQFFCHRKWKQTANQEYFACFIAHSTL